MGEGPLAQRLSRSAAELASHVSAAGLREHYARRMDKLREEQMEGAAKMAAAASSSGPLGLTSQSRVRVAVGVTCRCRAGDSTAYFKRGVSETLNLPIAETASYLIADLSDGAPHAVGSLRCVDPFERLCVCQILVFKGCLEVC